MENYRKLSIGMGLIIVIIVAFFLYYFILRPTHRESSKPEPFVSHKEKIEKSPSAEKAIQIEEPAKVESSLDPGITLINSDDYIRKNLEACSNFPGYKSFIQSEDIIMKVVAIINNIASHESPVNHLAFLAPREGFSVIEEADTIKLNPASYGRYDVFTQLVGSINSDCIIKHYRHLKPLFDTAFSELGYPGETLENSIQRALVVLLEVPLVYGDIFLEPKIKSYTFKDPKLENLSPPQKNLLRMGPQNIEIIQQKLKELANKLGIPLSELPESRSYIPENF